MLAVLLSWPLLFAAPPVGAAGPPDAGNSTVPAHINLVGTTLNVADPLGAFTVIVRDADNLVCPGVVVTLDVSGAPDVGLSDFQPVVTYLSCTQVSAITDTDGKASFIVVGSATNTSGNWSLTSTGTFTAGTTPIGTATVAAFDLDGVDGTTLNDYRLLFRPFYAGAPFPPVMDFDGAGGMSALDFSLHLAQLFAEGSTDPQAVCGASAPPGALFATGKLEIKVAPDCLTGEPTAFCSGTHTDLVFKVTSPMAMADVTSVLADISILGPPGPLPDFWRFDDFGCHVNGLLVTAPGPEASCYDGSAIFTDPGDLTTIEAGGGRNVTYPAPSGFPNEARVRLGLYANSRYVGPGNPSPPNFPPCEYGYGNLPFLGADVAFAMRIRNTTPCGGCATTPAVKIRLNSITFTRVQPADDGYSMTPKDCPGAAPPTPRGIAFPAGMPGRLAARGGGEPNTLVILPDGSGSNIISTDGSTTDVPSPTGSTSAPWLAPAAPNPTSGGTLIAFGLPASRHVRVAIVDVAGRVVRVLADGPFDAGEHRLGWDGTDGTGARVRAGVYYCRLVTDGQRRSTTIVLAR